MKPKLAVDVTDFTLIKYPVYGSPKIDGSRALMTEDGLRPRSLKRFKNKATNEHFDQFIEELQGFDGEMVVGNMNAPNMCRATTSGLGTIEGDPKATWYIFDVIMVGYDFHSRLKILRQRFKHMDPKVRNKMRIKLVGQRLIENAQQAAVFETEMLDAGYEGVVFISARSDYKMGRSTMKDQSFMRTKRFEDAEAEILEVIELERNQNEAKRNELGNQVRSSHKENKVGGATMGSLRCRVLTGPLKGAEFELGTGFDAAQRALFWNARNSIEGVIVKFKYFAHGVKDKPRWPSYQGLRDPVDMS